ncbi:hypothetical protein CWI38_0877p0020 [Hamiltosporidium tvaerminnensis]|uniref:Uncharacterized protein n=1 Tax=Hamiltosporidium tvaerminnensis TaxID=1176355 RepID=A0A4V2JXK5_9MICR|nr:hypothetical protein CWI38_0877p0020 [Hamiltosporidium tvaerminnensis]
MNFEGYLFQSIVIKNNDLSYIQMPKRAEKERIKTSFKTLRNKEDGVKSLKTKNNTSQISESDLKEERMVSCTTAEYTLPNLSLIDSGEESETILRSKNVDYFDKHIFSSINNREILEIYNILYEPFYDFVNQDNYVKHFEESYKNLLLTSKKTLENIFIKDKKYNLNGEEILKKIHSLVKIDAYINDIETEVSADSFFTIKKPNEISLQYIIFGEFSLYHFTGLYSKLLDKFGNTNELMNFLCNKTAKDVMIWSKELNQTITGLEKTEILKIFSCNSIKSNDFYLSYKNLRKNYDDLVRYDKEKSNIFYINTKKSEVSQNLKNYLLFPNMLLPQIISKDQVQKKIFFDVDLLFLAYINLFFSKICSDGKILYENFCCLENDQTLNNIIPSCWSMFEKSQIFLDFIYLSKQLCSNSNDNASFLIIFDDISNNLVQKLLSKYFKYEIFIFSGHNVSAEFVILMSKANIGFIFQIFLENVKEELLYSIFKDSEPKY